MKYSATQYRRHRFPPEIIQYAVWLHCRLDLGHLDVEDLLARRGILVTHESIRLWCKKFGSHYAHRLRRGHRGYGDTLLIDEVFVRIKGSLMFTIVPTAGAGVDRVTVTFDSLAGKRPVDSPP